MPHFFQSNLLRAKDAVRHAPAAHEALAYGCFFRASAPNLSELQKVKLLLRAYRVTSRPAMEKQVRDKLAPWLDDPDPGFWEKHQIGWEKHPTIEKHPHLTRSVILKAPSVLPGQQNGGSDDVIEKGLLLMLFEYNWLRLLRGVRDFAEFEKHFNVIWGATWSNTDYELLSYVLSKTSGPVYVQVGNLAEIPKLERFHPRIRCLKQMLAEWIRPENYQPKPVAERSRDILMLANWAPFKRHWHFFEVLSRMPADLKVTLIGQEESGRTRDNIRREARLFNVPQVLEIEQSIPPEQVAEIQCDSKVSAIFSRREGQCIALAESLCAGATIATLRDAHIGSTAYINEQTGQFLDRGREHRQLLDMVRNAEKFDPRGWALKHIAADISTPLLNNVFQEFEQQAGRPWTHDLLEFCMHPYPTLRHHPQREQMRPTIQALHQRYPQAFPADLLESSQS